MRPGGGEERAELFNSPDLDGLDSQDLANPAWKLEIGKTYLVDVHVKWSNAECKATFKLEYLSHNFGEFRLQAVK